MLAHVCQRWRHVIFVFGSPRPSVVGRTRAQRPHTVYGIELRDIPNSLLENIFAETPELERAIPNTDTTLIECEDDSGTLTLFLPAIMLTGPDVESAAVSSNHDSIHFQPPCHSLRRTHSTGLPSDTGGFRTSVGRQILFQL